MIHVVLENWKHDIKHCFSIDDAFIRNVNITFGKTSDVLTELGKLNNEEYKTWADVDGVLWKRFICAMFNIHAELTPEERTDLNNPVTYKLLFALTGLSIWLETNSSLYVDVIKIRFLTDEKITFDVVSSFNAIVRSPDKKKFEVHDVT